MHEGVTGEEKGKAMQSPESLAFEIESELLKLSAGVNKKYKERGRSLFFNLKDRRNPGLCERVISGEILPHRLCSMTAEELASEELSQWRIVKAEELDHMKVLPDLDVNMRHLVKKTHKGENQVDLDLVIGVSEETSPVTGLSSQKRPKINSSDVGSPTNAKETKAENDMCEINISDDGADMQGLMVDDMKGLPPIVSLDEFMESLNKDPPFENLPIDSGTATHKSNKENPELGPESRSQLQPSKHPVKIASHKTEEMGVEIKNPDPVEKSTDGEKGVDNNTLHLRKQEHIWQGLLQLNISSMAKFIALYKSGEKASTREWLASLKLRAGLGLTHLISSLKCFLCPAAVQLWYCEEFLFVPLLLCL